MKKYVECMLTTVACILTVFISTGYSKLIITKVVGPGFANDINVNLIDAARTGNFYEVKRLILKGANVNVKGKWNWTPLIYAAANPSNYKSICRLLILKGANVNVKGSKDGLTALMLAALNGHSIIVRLLMDNGANVNARDKNGYTALTYAIYKDHQNIVNILQNYGGKQ